MINTNTKYKYYSQLDLMDCAPTCLKMIAAFYGKIYSLESLRANMHITRNGVNINGISNAAEKIGFKTNSVKISYKKLVEDANLPCILHWNQRHFVVLYEIKQKNLFNKKIKYLVADPDHGLVDIDHDTFFKCWIQTDDERGVAVLLNPTPEFYKNSDTFVEKPSGFSFLLPYIYPYKKHIFQIVLGMLFSSIVSMIFPFLTQSLFDNGIQKRNINFVHLILFSQLTLFVGSICIDMIRSWVLLHVNTRLSLSIISSFLAKIMKLPINFFESKNVGDISQRINDHHRIEEFLTDSSLNTLFSLINIIVFSIVLGIYNLDLLLIFLAGSSLSVGWVFIFLVKRKKLDYIRFQRLKENQDALYELIVGMQEIKLNNCEQARRWKWEGIQGKLFKINIDSLSLEQYQEIGSSFFSQLKNILISYLSARLVFDNQITLGAMLSISYIIGQMNGPISQLITFTKKVQDAKLSLDRLGEIHNKPNEELNEEFYWDTNFQKVHLNDNVVDNTGIVFKNVSFRYGGPNAPYVLKNLNFSIPKGKVTAIVGASGSGKTTLMKLFLKFYPILEGEINIDGQNIVGVSAAKWREQCGTVMQDGYIFSDTIARNIAVDGKEIDKKRMMNSVRISNIIEYIEKFPSGFMTKVGSGGGGISGGQRQRIFIARAVYKDPQYLFFDEATSALDATNEKIIMENLNLFFKQRTVVIIAHRLSTVKNADQILVLQNGEIMEVGNHVELVKAKGCYFNLVKDQLELDNA